MKKYLLITLIVILGSCSGGGKAPPRNLDNACSMKAQRPAWFKTMEKAQRKWGVPIPVFLAAIHQESKFVADARTPYRFAAGVIPMGRQSSAFGYSQALDGTWGWYRRAESRPGAKRTNFADSVDFMGWYMNESRERNGISLNDAYNQYLAYHDGHTGFARGTYRRKPWLVAIAGKVRSRSIMYQQQLRTCS